MKYAIHHVLPSGFTLANEAQAEEFAKTGSINGASKVVLVASEAWGVLSPDVALRLRPPREWKDVLSMVARAHAELQGYDDVDARAWYLTQYNLGYAAATRGDSKAWNTGLTSAAWDDGYLDRRAERGKWHTTYCQNHNDCPEERS